MRTKSSTDAPKMIQLDAKTQQNHGGECTALTIDKRHFFTVESPNNKGRIKQRLP